MATATKTKNKGTATVPFTNVVRDIATKANMSPTDAGKAIRAHIRRNGDQLIKDGWTALKDHEPGNRYPALPKSFADKFIAGRVSTLAKSS